MKDQPPEVDDESLTVPMLSEPKIIELPPQLLASLNEIDRKNMETMHRMAQQLDWITHNLIELQNTYVRRIERAGKKATKWQEWVSSKWTVIAVILWPVVAWFFPKLMEKLFGK